LLGHFALKLRDYLWSELCPQTVDVLVAHILNQVPKQHLAIQLSLAECL
jgi:hypothetical protein